MLYRYFFPFTHHKRNIFHFLHCSLPVGRTSGQNLRAPKPRGHLTGSKLDSPLTQRETLARPNSGSSGRGRRNGSRTSTQQGSSGGASGRQSHGTLSTLASTLTQRETLARGRWGRCNGSKTSTQQGKLGWGLRAPKPRDTYRVPS